MKLQRHNAVGSADDDFSVRTNRNVGYLALRSTRARGMPSIENIERVRSSPPAMMAGLPATVPIATANPLVTGTERTLFVVAQSQDVNEPPEASSHDYSISIDLASRHRVAREGEFCRKSPA